MSSDFEKMSRRYNERIDYCVDIYLEEVKFTSTLYGQLQRGTISKEAYYQTLMLVNEQTEFLLFRIKKAMVILEENGLEVENKMAQCMREVILSVPDREEKD